MEGNMLLLILLFIFTIQTTAAAPKGKTRGEKLQEQLAQLQSQFEQFRDDVNRKLDPLFKTPEPSDSRNDTLPSAEPLFKLIRIEAEQEILGRLGRMEENSGELIDVKKKLEELQDRIEQFHPATGEDEIELDGVDLEEVAVAEDEAGEDEQGEDEGGADEEGEDEGGEVDGGEEEGGETEEEGDADEEINNLIDTILQNGEGEDEEEDPAETTTTTTTIRPMTVASPAQTTTTKPPLQAVNLGKSTLLELKIQKDIPSFPPFPIFPSNFAFTTAFHKELISVYGPRTLAFSPLGLSLALVVARWGAAGKTANQIDTALRLTPNLQGKARLVRTGFSNIIRSLQKPRETYNVSMGNIIHAQKGLVEPSQEFLAVSRQVLYTEMEELDFSSDHQGAADAINSWFENIQGKPRLKLMSAELLINSTNLLLLNTVHFNSHWVHPFLRQRTSKEPFHLNSSATSLVDMMSSSQAYWFQELPELGAKLVVLPYQGTRFSMHVFIPQEIDGLDGFLQAFQLAKMSMILSRMRRVNRCGLLLRLPKFKIQAALKLVEPLQKMGARDMFSGEDADFSGISTQGGLHFSNFFQQTYIDVNEVGTQGYNPLAPGSEALAEDCPSGTSTIKITADRPFYFQIWDDRFEMISFAGNFRGPNA